MSVPTGQQLFPFSIDKSSTVTQWMLSLCGLIGFFAIWEMYSVTLNMIPSSALPGPSEIITALRENQGLIWDNARVTIFSAGFGFVLAVVLGMVSAIGLAFSRRFRSVFYPILIAGNSVPRIAVAPLIIFYLGDISERYAHIAIAASVAYFTITVNAYEGFSLEDDNRKLLMKSVDATFYQELRMVRLQQALPHIFDGLKVGVTLAVVGAVVGEFVAANQGLGNLTLIALSGFNIEVAFASVVVMVLISLISFFSLFIIQDRIIHWKSTSLFSGE